MKKIMRKKIVYKLKLNKKNKKKTLIIIIKKNKFKEFKKISFHQNFPKSRN